jgi:hypothetical protein
MHLHYITGDGLFQLQACYGYLGIPLNLLPQDADEFVAADRQDGLVTYSGPGGPWEAVMTITLEQAVLLRNSGFVAELMDW